LRNLVLVVLSIWYNSCEIIHNTPTVSEERVLSTLSCTTILATNAPPPPANHFCSSCSEGATVAIDVAATFACYKMTGKYVGVCHKKNILDFFIQKTKEKWVRFGPIRPARDFGCSRKWVRYSDIKPLVRTCGRHFR